jgi:alkylhydroperoxidase family enzyme
VRALCEYAEKLTLRSAEVDAEDVEALRALGWSAAGIHDAVQVISYFNYINRVADAVGVEDEPEWQV